MRRIASNQAVGVASTGAGVTRIPGRNASTARPATTKNTSRLTFVTVKMLLSRFPPATPRQFTAARNPMRSTRAAARPAVLNCEKAAECGFRIQIRTAGVPELRSHLRQAGGDHGDHDEGY